MGNNAWLSTPAFEIFRRAIQTPAVKRFRGINVFKPVANLEPDWAQDLLNVIVGSNGLLSKMRLPQTISQAVAGQPNGPQSFWSFQQQAGLRQILANFGATFSAFQVSGAVPPYAASAVVDDNPGDGSLAGPWSFAALANMLFGANGSRMVKYIGNIAGTNTLERWGILQPAINPSYAASAAGTLSPVTGYQYSYSWKDSVTGDAGAISPLSPLSGTSANSAFVVMGQAPNDGHSDTIVWWRTIDGGGPSTSTPTTFGTVFRLCEVNIATGAITTPNSGTVVTPQSVAGQFLQIQDSTPDSALDLLTQGPVQNQPPPVGNYVCTGQNRLFVLNLAGSPQDIAYSGFETILYGNPQNCFPPFNRLRLAIGADAIAGGGVLQNGVVAFSQTNVMYMLRGQVEDISTSAPISYTQYLEELPWQLGCMNHWCIQATQYGLVWLAGDKTVQFFSGTSQPIDISRPVYPYLRRITAGSEGNCVSAYFNWLDRDWYCLLIPVDGSAQPNRMLLWSLHADMQEIDIFISDIQATWIAVNVNGQLQKQLVIAQGGLLKNLPVNTDTTGGITTDFSIIPATAGNLHAFWRSGYWGNDDSSMSKMFRFGKVVADQPSECFNIVERLVDDRDTTVRNPQLIGPLQAKKGRIPIGRRASRCSIELQFPSRDASVNVQELSVSYIETSSR